MSDFHQFGPITAIPRLVGRDPEEMDQRLQVLADNVSVHGLPQVYLNMVGGQDELVFDGGSMAIDETGAVVHRAPLFEEARRLGVGFMLGFAELTQVDGATRRFNTSILVDAAGRIALKYRKVHLPGHAEHERWREFQHLEKRYFEVGDLGFPVARAFGGVMGMMICNDRRWPESYRVMGLQGVEMILLGYNTPVHNPPAPEHDALSNFHNQLSMQAGAYQNGTWVVGVAKAGVEEGVMQIGQSQIIAPSGETVAMCSTLGDELAVARCDLDLTKSYKTTTFNFAIHRQPQAYGLIVERKGAIPPPDDDA